MITGTDIYCTVVIRVLSTWYSDIRYSDSSTVDLDMKMNHLNSFSNPTLNCLNMMTPQLNMLVQYRLHHIKSTMSTINTDTPTFKSWWLYTSKNTMQTYHPLIPFTLQWWPLTTLLPTHKQPTWTQLTDNVQNLNIWKLSSNLMTMSAMPGSMPLEWKSKTSLTMTPSSLDKLYTKMNLLFQSNLRSKPNKLKLVNLTNWKLA